MDTTSFQRALSGFGADGARNNRGYSACGTAIFAGEEQTNPYAGPQIAFGGIDQAEQSKKKLMTCPFCSAKVFGDPCARVLSCGDCRAKVVDGKVVSKGNGGAKARENRKTSVDWKDLFKKITERMQASVVREKLAKDTEHATLQKNRRAKLAQAALSNGQLATQNGYALIA
jgi:hypothetical protein